MNKEKIMTKGRASSFSLNNEQAETVVKAKAVLEKSLGVKLAMSQAVAVFAHLYLAKDRNG